MSRLRVEGERTMGKEQGAKPRISRRTLLRFGGGCLIGGLITHPAMAARTIKGERTLSFTHLHTGEKLRRTYWADGHYVPEALREIHYLMRDHRNDEVRTIDVRLLDLLHALHKKMDSRKPFELVSAYRSPATNAMLRKHTNGVARHSFHIQGMAADVRLSDRSLRKLRQAALQLDRGGVGYYPHSDFIHIDVGPQRAW